ILDDYSGIALVVLLAFPMAFWNIGLGQNAFLTAGLFGMATLLIDRRPIVAGLLFGLLCYKPHFGLLIPGALAAGGYWPRFPAAPRRSPRSGDPDRGAGGDLLRFDARHDRRMLAGARQRTPDHRDRNDFLRGDHADAARCPPPRRELAHPDRGGCRPRPIYDR